MLEQLTQCPICESPEAEKFLQVKDHSISQEYFQLNNCQSCGFCYTNPRPDSDSIAKYYESEDYISHSNTRKGLISKLYHIVRQKALKEKLSLINKLEKSSIPPHTILDYGCGTGAFLATCQDGAWQVEGLEPDTGARSQAEKLLGQKVYANFSEANFAPETFDLISLWHVLEHVHDLKNALEQIRRLLKPRGILLLALPNRDSLDAQKFGEFWAAYDVPRHLYHFNQRDVKNLADKHQFFLEQVLPMYYDAYYVSLLSEKYRQSKVPLWQGFWQGLKSNQAAHKNQNYSSLIYILRK